MIGEDAIEIYNTFSFSEQENKDSLETLMKKFTEHFEPQKNVTFERHVFNTRIQKEDEPVDQFITDLRLKAKSCEFGSLCDSLIKDRVVVGITSDAVRGRLLRIKDLTLEKAIEVCHAAEASSKQLDSIKPSENKDVHTVKAAKQQSRHQTKRDIKDCMHCGKNHAPKNCPAYGKVCKKCGKQNHFANKCFSESATKSAPRRRPKSRKVHKVNEESDSDSSESEFYMDAVHADGTAWTVSLKLQGNVKEKTIQFKLDTGAQCNAIPADIHRQMCTKVSKSKAKLVSYSGHAIKTIGKCTMVCEHKKKYHDLEFQVIDGNVNPVLGLQACEQLRLIKRVETLENNCPEIVEKYTDVFEGLGKLPGEHHIKLKPDAQPVVHPPRKVPVAMRQKVHQELDRMEKLGVIVKVEEPSPWVSSMVTVVKPEKDKVRICLDPKHLNDAIQREQYPMKI